jgi:SAM-dependent methyltransferase
VDPVTVDDAPRRAPGIPPDYYERIFVFEERHFWYVGMRRITAALLPRRRGEGRLLDAGCGTGGFLRWAIDSGRFRTVAGVDLGADAIALARRRVPEAELRVAPLHSLPFADESFDVVVTNDVLQHVPEGDVHSSLRELRRVLVTGGVLLVHTNGARRLRRERDDWRAYDRGVLARQLTEAGFVCERTTYANLALSLWGALRGRVPHAPSETTAGVPARAPSRGVSAVGSLLLAAEAALLRLPGARLPYGHTLFARAVKPLERGLP